VDSGVKNAQFWNQGRFIMAAIAIGAAGTNETINRLTQLGFTPIELERGSTGFKIWKKIKIKRVRVPDILCLSTGLRFESRGKTKPEISMSHSLRDPRRAWDAGLRSDDYVSIVLFEQGQDPVSLRRVSPVHFIKVADLKQAFDENRVKITKPKGFEEGSEIRVQWTCAVAKQPAIVSEVTEKRLRLKTDSGERQNIHLLRNKGRTSISPQVSLNQSVETNQIVASIVPIHTSLQPQANLDELAFISKLEGTSLSERYGAAKALRFRGYEQAQAPLEGRLNDPQEDIYIKLEAAAALAAFDYASGWDFLEANIRGSLLQVPLETQLETVIVTSEICRDRSQNLLIEVLQDSSKDEELRAGAAWALGQFVTPVAANALVDTFNGTALEIKTEAARALLRIAEPQLPHLVSLLKTAQPAHRDGISWALAKTGKFDPSVLLQDADDNLRRWVSYIIGYAKEELAEQDLNKIFQGDPEVYFAASVLWQILESWTVNLTEY